MGRVDEPKVRWNTTEILREFKSPIEAFAELLHEELKTPAFAVAMNMLREAHHEQRKVRIGPHQLHYAGAVYDHFSHRHNFAVWAAARATQRGFTSVAKLKAALESCDIVEFLCRDGALQTDGEEFDRLHRAWCEQIRDNLTRDGVKNATHGRAAKLVAVYLKAMVVNGPDSDSRLARVAHPPIDRILLKNLARAAEIRSPHKKLWAKLNWTTLDADTYDHLISQLRECLNEGEPMWHLERYWTVT